MAIQRANARDILNRVRQAQEAQRKTGALETVARTLEARRRQMEVTDRLKGVIEAEAAWHEAIAELARQTNLVPVALGDLAGPAGNVFHVISSCRSALNTYVKAGNVPDAGAYDVIENFMDRTYEQTLDMIQMYYLDVERSIIRLRARLQHKSFYEQINQPSPKDGNGTLR